MSRRRSVSFSETIENCERRILDESSHRDYLNSWYSRKEHKYFKNSVQELAELLETRPNLKNSRTQSTIFRGIERHTTTEKVRIREKREISYCIVESLQDKSRAQMAKMLRSHSDECLSEAQTRALEDGEHSQLPRSTSRKFDKSNNKDTIPSLTSPRRKPQSHFTSRPTIARSF